MKIIPPAGSLYLRYLSQPGPQPCEVFLSCDDAVLTVAVRTEIGNARSIMEWNGRHLTWRVPTLTMDAANDLLAELAPLAERVFAGYSCVWDGHNMVGEYNADAQEASEAIALLCDREWPESAIERVWTADEWFAPLGDRATQRRELGVGTLDMDAIERREMQIAAADGVAIDGLREHLEWLAKS